LVHAGNKGKGQIKNTYNSQTKQNPEKAQITQNTAKQNYPSLVAFYDTQPGNEVGLFYNAHTGREMYACTDLALRRQTERHRRSSCTPTQNHQ